MYNPPALTNHPTIQSPIETPSRQNSVLASILESVTNDNKRVGCAFFVMEGDKLSRRGIVLHDTPRAYTVQFVDVFGMPDEVKKVSKARASSWKWFISVEHSNHTYDKLLKVN